VSRPLYPPPRDKLLVIRAASLDLCRQWLLTTRELAARKRLRTGGFTEGVAQAIGAQDPLPSYEHILRTYFC